MTEKELRKLGRGDLMQLLLELSRENDRLRSQLASAEQKLNDRQLQLADAGTMAEAALKLNGVFEAADAACKQYMENIQRLTREMATNACQNYMGNLQSLSLERIDDYETRKKP